jgi:probable HAF family extracellular repeat protein
MRTSKVFGSGKVLKVAARAIACTISGVGLFAETTVTFELLGYLPIEGSVESIPYAVSADGAIVVGLSGVLSQEGDDEAFRWEDGTMTGLGYLGGEVSEAHGVSADGSVVVGGSGSPSEAFRWVDGVMTGLGHLEGGETPTNANGVSEDGSVVVGGSGNYWAPADESSGAEAFRWEDGTMTGLGDLPGGVFFSEAFAVSADGEVAVGYSFSSSGHEAFRWENDVMTGLGDLEGGEFWSEADGVSADGSVVVGFSSSSSGYQAFRWENDVMTGLGYLPGGGFSWAFGVSADGSVVVGTSTSSSGWQAVFWSEDNNWQPVSLNDFLDSEGVDRNDVVLEVATAISADGTTIVGYTSGSTENPSQAFRFRILDLDPLIGGASIKGLQDWFLSDWFGAYNTTLAPWLFHAQHGFIYRYPESTNEGMFAYDDKMGVWWWTSESNYSYIYAFDPPADNAGTDIASAWLYYFKGSKTPRSFGVVTGDYAGEFLYFGP